MCDYFLQRMEGDQAGGGDLTDIVRAGGAMPANSDGDLPSTAAEWQLQPADQPMLFPPQPQPPPSSDGFGDPFAGLRDPFSSDYSAGAADYLESMPDAMAKVGFDAALGGGGQMLEMGGRKPLMPARGMQQMMQAGMCGGGMGSRLMSSSLSPIAIRPYPAMTAGDMMKLGITAGQAAGCAIDAAVAGMQMSSPRNAGGIKRRKNQARKVVCIPAPAAAGSRPTGEVVPSDLWAWRKYGQKPIKGSPHPRGYYRCSSSKGCSARKQVERSRTDPSMLVITYTSEHNHPWPTQRNALAGSTRSHHGKNGSGVGGGGGSSGSGSKSSHNEKQSQTNNVKEERKDHRTATTTTTATSTVSATTCTSPMIVKEETMTLAGSSDQGSARGQRSMNTAAGDHSELLDHVFSESYRPMMPESSHHEDFFADFADLAELESDPMSLIYSKEYMEARPSGVGDNGKEKAAVEKGLDPFDMLDWSTPATSTVGGTSEQGKRGETN